MTSSPAPISLPIAFDGDRMVITNPVSNRRLHRKRLSPSTAKAMEGCPARYAAEKLMPGLEDPFGAAPVGTSGHAVMEALMQQLPADRTQQRAEELLITELLNEAAPRPKDGWPGILATRGAEWLSCVRAAFSGLFGIEDPAEVDVFSTEMHLDTAEVAGVPFVGYIDRVERITSRSGEVRFKVVDYKGLALDTPIPTADGSTTMGDLKVGDRILSTNGQLTRVIGKSQVHHRPCYEVVFTDGERIICDNVHLWEIGRQHSGRRLYTKVMNADELYAEFADARLQKRRDTLVIDNPSAVELPAADLPIDPWLLGPGSATELRGAGTSGSGVTTS